ncbi:MAG: ABC transporter substrate-binding protein [Actinomycetota bacterium]
MERRPGDRAWVYRSVAVVAAAVLLTGACAGNGDDGPDAPDQAEVPQELVVGAGDDAYETKGDTAQVGQYPVNANIFEGLVKMDADYGIVSALATEWEFEAPNTWRFTLRDGVTFHDGQPFDANAVKYTFDRVAKAGGGTPGFGEDSTKVIDDLTVEVTPTFENRRFVEQIVHPEYSIVAPGTIPSLGKTPEETPVGTGPFKFVEYQRQQQLVVERFDDYWGEPATLDKLTFRFIPEANARRLALEAEEVDLIVDAPREAIADLEAKGFVTSPSDVGAYEALYANISGKKGYTILQDRAVRQAVSYAIDRDTLVEGVFEGLAANEQTMIPARLLGDSAELIEPYPHDPEEAALLLDDAGWTEGTGGIREKDGQPLTLELINGFPTAQAHSSVPEFVQAQLKEVGIDVKIVATPDTPAYEERLNAGEGDLWIEQGSQNDANPAFLPALLFWSEGLFGDIGYQPLFAPGGQFDDIIVDALATPDPDEVKELVAQAMSILIEDEAIVIPLAGIYRINVMSSEVQGFEPQPSQLQVRYDTVSMTEG